MSKRWARTCLYLILGHCFPLHPTKDGDSPLVLLCCFGPVCITWLDLGLLLSDKLMVKDLTYYRRRTCGKCLSSLWNSEGCMCRHFLDILLPYIFALAISQSCKLWKLLSWSCSFCTSSVSTNTIFCTFQNTCVRSLSCEATWGTAWLNS